jgi:hypothetical protein
MCLAPTRHVTKVRLSIDSPHRVVIPRRTPEYQYPRFRFCCASLFPACWMLHYLLTWRPLRGHQRLSRRWPQTRQPSLSPQHRRRLFTLPRASMSTCFSSCTGRAPTPMNPEEAERVVGEDREQGGEGRDIAPDGEEEEQGLDG